MLDTETKKRTSKVSSDELEDVIFIIVTIMLFISILISVEASVPFQFTILNTSINSMPINSGDAYPILLQGFLIVAGILFGFYSVLLFNFIGEIKKFINKHISGGIGFRSFLMVISLSIVITPILYLFISIFFAFHAAILYGVTLTYTTEQISTNSIPTNSIPANISNIWNSTYFELIKNYSSAGTTAYYYYQSLNTNTQNSIRLLYYAGGIIFLILMFYMLGALGFFEHLIDEYNKHRIIGSFSILGIFALFFYLLKHYFVSYVIVAVMITLIIILFIAMKQQKLQKSRPRLT